MFHRNSSSPSESMGRQRGFTLIEILLVLALLGIMLAVVVPNLTGFLGRGKRSAWEGDRRTIQASANAYYTDTAKRPGSRVYPLMAGYSLTSAFPYIDMEQLKGQGYLSEHPQSSSTTYNNNTGNAASGSYSWYIEASSGMVKSSPDFVENTYP